MLVNLEMSRYDASRHACVSHSIDLMEQKLTWDTRLRSIEFVRSVLKRSYHLLYNLIKKHSGQLGVEQRAELERYLRTAHGQSEQWGTREDKENKLQI